MTNLRSLSDSNRSEIGWALQELSMTPDNTDLLLLQRLKKDN